MPARDTSSPATARDANCASAADCGPLGATGRGATAGAFGALGHRMKVDSSRFGKFRGSFRPLMGHFEG